MSMQALRGFFEGFSAAPAVFLGLNSRFAPKRGMVWLQGQVGVDERLGFPYFTSVALIELIEWARQWASVAASPQCNPSVLSNCKSSVAASKLI